MQSSFLSKPPKNSSKPEGEQTKIDKGKKAMSSKDAKEESTKSDYDDKTIHVPGSTVESSKKKELKRFDFITEDREHVHLTKEQISAQKKIEEEAKAEAASRKGEIRKEELIDLLGPEVVKKYYNDKLQYDKYYDKMLNRREKSRITNCDILTKKGLITLKVYREDDTSEIIHEFKASDLHLAELGIDLDRPLSNQDPLDRLNDLANKKRKHADDIHDYFRANKRLKSSVQYKDHPAGTVLNELVLASSASALHVLRKLGSIFISVNAGKLKRIISLLEGLQGGKRLLYVKRNKAISLGNVTSKVGIKLQNGGLKIIENDVDVHAMYDLVEIHKKINVYVAHVPQNLAEFYHHNLTLDGSDEEVTSRNKLHDLRKKDDDTMAVNELVTWAEEEASTPFLRSLPLKTRPFRNPIECMVLFRDQHCIEDEHLEHGPPLTEDEMLLMLKCLKFLIVLMLKSLLSNKKLDKGKGKMSEADIFTSKKQQPLQRGNGITIRENENPLPTDTDSSNSEDYSQSESESDCSEKSFDYLSDCDDEVIELRKRRFEYKYSNQEDNDDTVLETGKEECTQSSKFEDVLNNDVVLTPLVKDHERNMQYLLKKLKGNHMGITDLFAIVEKQNEKFPIYDQQTHWKLKEPKCLTYYALANGFSLWFDKSTSKKVIAKCRKRKEVIKDADIGKQRAFKKFPCNDEKPVCKWRCYGKMMKDEASFLVRSLVDEHTCVRNFQYGRLVDYKWIGRNFGDKIRANPQITLDAIVELVMKKYKCIVSRTQCRHAKSFALNEGDAALQDHYGYLRRVIALDGGFLKKPNSGEILTAVGRDGNNHIFLVAWAVVTVENKDNWSWFLDLLADNLEVPNGNGLTLISDKHKGLIEAVKEIIPLAEHRQCARHIYEGFRKQFGMCCEAVEKGFSECFNSVLVSVRHKPIITMLESMRVIIMERMNTMRHLMEKWNGEICQNIKKILELRKDQQRFWHVIPCSENLFEVRKGSKAFRVDEPKRTCSCRMWQLSGLPCCHAIACIFRLNRIVEGHLSTVLCLKPKRMPGRPKKKRIRASHEPKFSTTKISRARAIMTCHNCWEKGNNKSTCKKDPIPVVPKEKGKPGRPKNQQNMETMLEDNEIPTFMHNPIDEMRASNSRGVFDDKRVNNKKRGASCSNANQNRRGGKTKGGKVFPTQRLGRMATWFGIDPANSDTIKNTQDANDPLPTNNTQAGNIPVLLTTQESTRTERPRTRRVVAEQMLQTRSEGAAQRQAKQRQPSNFVPPRKKSKRLQNLEVAKAVTQGGSTNNVTRK
ncbi:pentatricopeptide repeat-containing protein [Tanacetum coccineum]